jgi:hypothetical protein
MAWSKRKATRFGEGPEDASIMLVGQNPGKEEVKQCRPFVGRSGQYLKKVLHQNGPDRRKMYLTGVVKEPTPGNRKPRADLFMCLFFAFLALRAKIGCSARDSCMFHPTLASGTLVVAVPMWRDVRFWKAVRISATVDGRLENSFHAVEEYAQLLVIETVHLCSGVDPSLKKHLIRIDVSDSGHDLLVHEGRLYGTFPALERLSERLGVEFRVHRIRTQILRIPEVLDATHEVYLTQLSLAGKGKVIAIRKTRQHSVVRRIIVHVLEVFEVTGHSKMQDKPLVIIELGQEIFAMAICCFEAMSFETGPEFSGRNILQNVTAPYLHIFDFLMKCRGIEILSENLHIGQLRHDRLLSRIEGHVTGDAHGRCSCH